MYSILPLDKRFHSLALEFVCRQFVAESPLHSAVGIAYEEYVDYLREPFASMVAADMSFVALDRVTSELIGCLIVGDFTTTHEYSSAEPVAIKPIKQLIAELEEAYRQHRLVLPGQVALVDIAVVAASVRKQGVYRQLRAVSHDAAIEKGFKWIVGELSSAATQYYCVEKLRHQVICEVNYHAFCYQGSYPFRSISEPDCIQLVEGVLKTDASVTE